ncbi:U3 snoRNP protein [Coemansia nantahalensis]|uniref:U3 snoRNP protein n=1 Tax=Coemansia nantahalensis TaxID=2789366 RepID=A0ACC1JR31_9FUNG|nr:U3 snoRNP protein [Coemansia nantahalensis]
MGQKENAYLQGAVAQVVFEQAVRAVPGSLGFRQELAAAAAQYPDMEPLRQRVLESIAADFGDDAQARAFLCVAHLSAVSTESPELVDALQLAVQKFAAALAALDTPEMWTRYAEFLAQWQRACAGDASGAASLQAYFAALLARAVRAIGEQRDTRLDAGLALTCADTLEATGGDVEEWLADATRRFPDSADLWHRRLAALLRGGPASDAARVERLFADEALAHVPQSRKLWDLWADWIEGRFAAGALAAAGVQAQYLAACARVTQQRAAHATRKDGAAALVAVVARLQVRYVDWAWSRGRGGDSDDDEQALEPAERGNVEALRLAYSNIERHAFPTQPFYRRCLALEPDAARRAALHERACCVDEADARPWTAYLRFLVAGKQLEKAANVYWRAANAVPEAQRAELEAAYQKLLNGGL